MIADSDTIANAEKKNVKKKVLHLSEQEENNAIASWSSSLAGSSESKESKEDNVSLSLSNVLLSEEHGDKDILSDEDDQNKSKLSKEKIAYWASQDPDGEKAKANKLKEEEEKKKKKKLEMEKQMNLLSDAE